MITLTEKAKDYMKSVILNGDKVTLSVKGGGCSGFQYVWGLMNDSPDVKWSEPIDDLLVIDPLAESPSVIKIVESNLLSFFNSFK